MLVLEVISGLCRDPLALVEMFVNYDCDLQAIDLFKRIVTALVKVRSRRFFVLPVWCFVNCLMCWNRSWEKNRAASPGREAGGYGWV